MRGRKLNRESRGAEFRRRLSAWRQTPESMRQSLRALARELGTSHQLLKHYLDGLDTWQADERAKQIQERAEVEGRPMTLRECCDAHITPVFFRWIEELRQKAKRGPLNYGEIKMLKLFAKQGFPGTKELLEKHGSPTKVKEQRKKLELSPKQQLVLKTLPPAERPRYVRWLLEE